MRCVATKSSLDERRIPARPLDWKSDVTTSSKTICCRFGTVIVFGCTPLLSTPPIGSRYAWTWMSLDRKSTRLNSSHSQISYAVFCLEKYSDLDPVVSEQ